MQENATRPEEEASEPALDGAAMGADGAIDDFQVERATLLDQEDWQSRAEDYLGKWHRVTADMANMRRRHDLDRQEYTRQANAAIMKDLLQVLDSFDGALATIPADPTLHEALMQEESDQPADTVVGELQRGYKLHDRVLRPAMVKVAK